MIKILTYVSKINKNEKEIKKLNYTCMRNIKINFDEKEYKIKYEEYFFNEIPSPKDIEFEDIDINNFKIYWIMNDINLLNIDKNKIKFKIEIKKENSDDNFNKIYEGSEMNYLINNLNSKQIMKLEYVLFIIILIIFIINVIIKVQQLVYLKMKKDIFLVDMLLLIGQVVMIINQLLNLLYLH